MKVLLTGYEPFGGEDINPALEAVKALHGQKIGGAEVVAEAMPVVWGEVLPKFVAAVEKHQPHVVISVGQAGSRAKITPEQIGINLMQGKDNAGQAKNFEPIVPRGPDAYFTNLPIHKMIAAMQEVQIPAALSYTAGAYLCNYLAYMARHHAESKGLNYKSIFIHIPFLPQQVIDKPAATPSLPLETVVAGLRECIKVAVEEG